MKKEYIEDLKIYLAKNGKLDTTFGKYSKMYSMTTENISGFLKNYDLKGKKILTVAGSGDQRLNAYLMGADSVTCFDINPLTECQLNLKDEVIKNVNFEKFINFFGLYTRRYGNNYSPLDKKIFNDIACNLNPDTFNIFNYIINERTYIDHNDIYFKFCNSLELLKNVNDYLNKDNYDDLKEIIKNKTINFIESDVTNLPNKLGNEKYDLILLSNISDYIHKMYPNNSLVSYRELIDDLASHLNLYGTIQVGYIYANYRKENDISSFHKKNDIIKYFPTDKFHTTLVNSFDNNDEKDYVITYQKIS